MKVIKYKKNSYRCEKNDIENLTGNTEKKSNSSHEEYCESSKCKKKFRDTFNKLISFLHNVLAPLIMNFFLSGIVFLGLLSKSYSILMGKGLLPSTLIEALAFSVIIFMNLVAFSRGGVPPDCMVIPMLVVYICILLIPVMHFFFPDVVIQITGFFKSLSLTKILFSNQL